ncbi:MAG: biotin--[acetyl-CoA-carboxylase] ligase [Acidimicrobiales bacterium]|nr:biotin--[acetyl-CoA-carboxylase] ligase [Acidimicrobiales bacterium]
MPGTRFSDIRRLESVDSTNRYLLDEARAGADDGVVAVADHQSAGRGRLGRRWEAPAGSNLLMSVLLRPDLPPDHRYLAAAVVALAATDAVDVALGLELGIKWPNDLLALDGRKVAGVLAEADVATAAGGSDGRGSAIVVGIGINVNWPGADADLPPDLVGLATSLRQQLGRRVDRTEVLEALLEALGPRVGDLSTAAGRIRQVDGLRARCTTIGTRVRVELADGRFEGTACAVTPEGHLVVETGGARRTVVAGDVVHVRPPGQGDRPIGAGADPE